MGNQKMNYQPYEKNFQKNNQPDEKNFQMNYQLYKKILKWTADQTKELSNEQPTMCNNFQMKKQPDKLTFKWTTNQTKEALWPSFQEPHQAKPRLPRLQSVQNACYQAYNAAAMKLNIIFFSKKQHVD